ncbi:class I SAM-dependent methyltransferase [Microbacterium sp. SS28]|uniref:class I SAM-dependent methyltransferase n=1 Tax=Microbacterium sp. SS28 TaxID=2919948 RepID=UPI001FAA203B|nr:class I SAM-dependent methyltransferase [Microbacterium sp. SS28]
MTTFEEPRTDADAPPPDDTRAPEPKLTLAQVLEIFAGGRLPLRFSAYDGSSAGPPDAPYGLDLKTPRGTTYLATGFGDLGLARAYIAGDLDIQGLHPGDPYELLKALADSLVFTRPSPRVMAQVVRSIGFERLKPIAPPPQEVPPRWRRVAGGLRHSKNRDAEAIHHHYDVSNTFYEWVLGPSMTYTCACYPRPDASLEEAQENKYRLVFDKLRLKPGDRLLDVGCGWGGMVRYAARRGVKATGVTLSREQTAWAQQAIADEGLGDLAEVRFGDYRDIAESGYDAVSSIGLLEHIGVHNYASYFRFLRSRLRPGGMLLNHCITRPDNRSKASATGFIDRYVFPDGELTGAGRIITEAQDAGLEVLHEENLRRHYALTLRDWCANLVEHWDEAVAEIGLPAAKVWGLYMAGSRLAFESGGIELHHVLAVKPDERGDIGDVPMRPWWTP